MRARLFWALPEPPQSRGRTHPLEMGRPIPPPERPGRALEPLRTLSGATDPLLLVGSHGAEDSRHPDGLALDEEQRALLATVQGVHLDVRLDGGGRVQLSRRPVGTSVAVDW